MLRNRSRAVTKQTPIMSDHQPTTQNQTRPIYSSSPRFFNGGFLIKHFSATLATKKEILNFASDPFRFTKNPEKPLKDFKIFQENFKNFYCEGIALVLDQENHIVDICSKDTNKRKVLLKIQIRPGDQQFENWSPGSPGDFGIKTKNAYIWGDLTPTGFGSRKYSTGPLSMREMELSEEYTCVIKNGPNRKTTHIYDNCVVDSCCGIRVGPPPPTMMVESVVGFCETCKKKLGEGCDIFMYRGEKAFCSVECRCQEMILDGLINT